MVALDTKLVESGPWGPLTAGCTRVVLISSLQELQDCFQADAQNVAEGGGAGSDHSQVKKAKKQRWKSDLNSTDTKRPKNISTS